MLLTVSLFWCWRKATVLLNKTATDRMCEGAKLTWDYPLAPSCVKIYKHEPYFPPIFLVRIRFIPVLSLLFKTFLARLFLPTKYKISKINHCNDNKTTRFKTHTTTLGKQPFFADGGCGFENFFIIGSIYIW